MPASQISSGPAFLLIGGRNSSTPRYFGTGQVGPDLGLEGRYAPIMNDLTGTVPLDMIYSSQIGTTTVTMTRWDENVLVDILSFPHRNTSIPGATAPGDVGALMIAEALAYPLWIWFSRAAGAPGANPVMVGLGMPTGRHYYTSILAAPVARRTGSQANSIGLSWIHLPVLVSQGTSSYNAAAASSALAVAGGNGRGGLICWDQNMAAVNAGLLS